MNRKIYINNIDGVESPIDMIALLPNAESYLWKILWVDINGIKFSELKLSNMSYDFHEFENIVNDLSSDGLLVSVEEIYKINEWVFQFIDILLIGDKIIEKLKRYENHDEMKEKCKYVLELVDNSFWEVSSNDTEFNNNIFNCCPAAEYEN